MGQDPPRVIIRQNYDGLESRILHTKFRRKRPTGFGEKIFEGFLLYVYGPLVPSWSCDHDRANKLSILLPTEAPQKNQLDRPWFQRRSLKLWTTDDDERTPDHCHPISSSCEPSAQLTELKSLYLRNEFHFSGVHGAMNRSGSRASFARKIKLIAYIYIHFSLSLVEKSPRRSHLPANRESTHSVC